LVVVGLQSQSLKGLSYTLYFCGFCYRLSPPNACHFHLSLDERAEAACGQVVQFGRNANYKCDWKPEVQILPCPPNTTQDSVLFVEKSPLIFAILVFN
jgi:hypothetical protein